MKISVVIATFNRRDLLALTLPTVFAQDFPSGEYEVIVVVDGSTDGTVELLRSFQPPCVLHVLEQPNRGQTAALNAGVNAAQGHLVLFLDDDIVCDRTLLREHLAAHRGVDPMVAMGPLFVASESPATLATEWLREFYDAYHRRLELEMEPRFPDDTFLCPNTSVPRSTLLACGGFDEHFITQEDLELGLRLWKMGVRFRYVPTAVTHHIYKKSAREAVREDMRWYGSSDVLLCRKHPDYRPHSELRWLAEGTPWMRAARELAVRLPVSSEPLFRIPFWAAEPLRWIPWIRRLGLRLLQYRCNITRYRSALREVGSWKALRAEFGLRLPVLLYHHVGPVEQAANSCQGISPAQFERQVRWLARHGYVGIRPSDWLAWCRAGTSLPDKPVLVTFDDACADLADHALPVLRRCGFGAAVFVVAGQASGTNAWDDGHGSRAHRPMTAEQIREWASQGVEFGVRSCSDSASLNGADPTEEQLIHSRSELASVLETQVVSFAYPDRRWNEVFQDRVRATFDLAFTPQEGLNSLRTDLHLLKRTRIQPGESVIDLACRLRLGWNPLEPLRLRAARLDPVPTRM